MFEVLFFVVIISRSDNATDVIKAHRSCQGLLGLLRQRREDAKFLYFWKCWHENLTFIANLPSICRVVWGIIENLGFRPALQICVAWWRCRMLGFCPILKCIFWPKILIYPSPLPPDFFTVGKIFLTIAWLVAKFAAIFLIWGQNRENLDIQGTNRENSCN